MKEFTQEQISALAALVVSDRFSTGQSIGFKDLESASEAVAALIGSGLGPAALELLPPGLINLMNRKKNLNLPEVPSLFCEFHGISKTSLQEYKFFISEWHYQFTSPGLVCRRSLLLYFRFQKPPGR